MSERGYPMCTCQKSMAGGLEGGKEGGMTHPNIKEGRKSKHWHLDPHLISLRKHVLHNYTRQEDTRDRGNVLFPTSRFLSFAR